MKSFHCLQGRPCLHRTRSPFSGVRTRPSFAPTASRPCATAAAAVVEGSGFSPPADSEQQHHPTAGVLRWATRGWAPVPPDTPAYGAAAAAATAEPQALRVAVANLGPGRGRGLVAVEDVAPGETLLSVPLTRVFASDPSSELHWSAEMALRLLQARHARQQQQQQGQHAGSTGQQEQQEAGAEEEGDEEGDRDGLGPDGWGPWLAALPTAVRTPLEYGEDLVRQLGCPYVMDEIRQMQQCVRDCYEVLEPELRAIRCGWPDFLWAVQVFHSRCFFDPGSGRHMCVPGVDMANHSPDPNAAVRIVHSPGACQGYDAVAEIAEPPPPEPSRFSLVAGDAGIRCGEEVTISYGRWPAEAFLLLFGFVPAPSPPAAGAPSTTAGTTASAGVASAGGGVPGNCLVLFRDGEEAVRWALEQGGLNVAAEEDVEDVESQVASLLEEAYELAAGEELANLVITPAGVDGRLQVILDLVSRRYKSCNGTKALLSQRVRERLACFDPSDVAGDEVVRSFVTSKHVLCMQLLSQLS